MLSSPQKMNTDYTGSVLGKQSFCQVAHLISPLSSSLMEREWLSNDIYRWDSKNPYWYCLVAHPHTYPWGPKSRGLDCFIWARFPHLSLGVTGHIFQLEAIHSLGSKEKEDTLENKSKLHFKRSHHYLDHILSNIFISYYGFLFSHLNIYSVVSSQISLTVS